MATYNLFPTGETPQLLNLANQYRSARRPVTTPQSLDESADLSALNFKPQNIYLEDFIQRQPTAQELLAKALNERAIANREAVDLRRQQQVDMGMVPVQPNLERASILDDYLRSNLMRSNLPQPSPVRLPTQTQVVPGIGHLTEYPNNERVMTGRYGTGVATMEKPKERTIEGIPAAEWFKQAAIRQGADNKYARAEATGKTDKLGRPILKAVGIPVGSDASTERIFEGMKSGKYVPAKGGWQSKTA